MLHRIWQVHHIMPHEVYNLPRPQKLFLYASEELAHELEEEHRKEAERKRQSKGRRK